MFHFGVCVSLNANLSPCLLHSFRGKSMVWDTRYRLLSCAAMLPKRTSDEGQKELSIKTTKLVLFMTVSCSDQRKIISLEFWKWRYREAKRSKTHKNQQLTWVMNPHLETGEAETLLMFVKSSTNTISHSKWVFVFELVICRQIIISFSFWHSLVTLWSLFHCYLFLLRLSWCPFFTCYVVGSL